MKRLAILLVSFLALSACNDVVEPERGLVPSRAARRSTLVPTEITMTDLGTLNGSSSSDARAINELGDVVGQSGGHAFLWRNGTMTDLGTLGGSVSFASAVNDLGQVAGTAQTSDGATHVFLWQNGVMTDVSHVAAARPFLNNLGQVAWTSSPLALNDRSQRAFLWQNGTNTSLGTLGSATTAFGLNDVGQVVGSSLIEPNVASHAFLWQNGTMTDLGTLANGLTFYSAAVVNALGQVWGTAQVSDDYSIHAFRWQNGVMTDMNVSPYANSRPFAINDVGQVVGTTQSTDDGYSHGVLWHDGVMSDLGSLGGSTQPLGLNNLGQIIGRAFTADGAIHAVLWQNGVMTDLGESGSSVSSPGGAVAINDRGQIAGTFQGRAVLWNTLRPATPAEEVSILTSKVNALVAEGTLSHGQGESLLSKLNAASAQIARGNANAAVNVLQAFIKHVDGQVAAGLYSSATGQTLTDAARAAISRLTG